MTMRCSDNAAVCAALLAVLLTATGVQAAWQVNLVSDIHFDPVYGESDAFGKCTTPAAAKLGQRGCDSPLALVDSTVADLTNQRSDITLYMGDSQRHNFAEAHISAAAVFTPLFKGIMQIATTERIPAPAFAGSWGNNDVVPDYFFNTSETSQPDLKERANLMEVEGAFTSADAATFSKCGFYARRTETLAVIALHTLLWANSIKPPVGDDTDPCGQFAFLEAELTAARNGGQKVIVLGHIPPVLDSFQVLTSGSFTNAAADMFWQKNFQDRYEKLLADNKDIVKLQLFGHTHLFNVFAFANVGVPSLVVPGITPVFGNSPSYLLGRFSDAWELEGLNMRYLQDTTWVAGMDVKGALGLKHGFNDIDGLRSDLYALARNQDLWENYMPLHSGGVSTTAVYPGGSCKKFCRYVTICAMVNSAYDDVKSCVTELNTPTDDEVNLSGSIVTIVLLLGVVIATTVIIVLYHLIPKIRAGELKLSKYEFDLRAQLLNATPKKEKRRREAAAKARREARYRDEAAGAAFSRPTDAASASPMSVPRREGDEEMVSIPFPDHNPHNLGDATFVDDHTSGRE